jgi:hypothetical protein
VAPPPIGRLTEATVMTRQRTWTALVAVLVLGLTGTVAAQVLIPGGALAERFAARRAALLAQLQLSPDQVGAWAQVERRRGEFALGLRSEVDQLAQRVRADLADPNVDLRRTARTVQDSVDRQIAAHRELVEARLAFYEQLDPEQQARVRAELLARLERLENLREALRDLAPYAQ